MTALGLANWSLVEASRFVEFDGDDAAQSELIKVAGTDQFDHRVAQLRSEREEQRRYEQTAAAFAAQGYAVLDRRPAWSDKTYIPTNYLRNTEGKTLTDEAIAAMDPQHWAVVLESAEAFVDTETGEPVDENDIDFDTADDPSAEPAEGPGTSGPSPRPQCGALITTAATPWGRRRDAGLGGTPVRV